MTRRSRPLVVVLLGLCAGCDPTDAPGDAALPDAASLDGALPDGAAGDGGSPDAEQLCDPLGDSRLCGEYCDLPCPDGVPGSTPLCNTISNLCDFPSDGEPGDDPRGAETCGVDDRFSEYCYRGGLCLVTPHLGDPDVDVWWGVCVNDEYCAWMQTRPELADDTCRYSDGTFFVDGPPDHECAEGAHPDNPFCGGACGDTCPENLWVTPDYSRYPVHCVGRSETRGFGVCTLENRRCVLEDPGSSYQAIDNCELGIGYVAPCVCMFLSPAFPEEHESSGWAVSAQSCAAYQARYPGEVRCISGDEL